MGPDGRVAVMERSDTRAGERGGRGMAPGASCPSHLSFDEVSRSVLP